MCLFQLNPDCECNKFSGCVGKGTMDMSRCVDFFVSLSAPHFYLAEEKLRIQVDGMNPNAKIHESGVYFDLVCISLRMNVTAVSE